MTSANKCVHIYSVTPFNDQSRVILVGRVDELERVGKQLDRPLSKTSIRLLFCANPIQQNYNYAGLHFTDVSDDSDLATLPTV